MQINRQQLNTDVYVNTAAHACIYIKISATGPTFLLKYNFSLSQDLHTDVLCLVDLLYIFLKITENSFTFDGIFSFVKSRLSYAESLIYLVIQGIYIRLFFHNYRLQMIYSTRKPGGF